MDVTPASTDQVDEITDRWVDLATSQRAYGSHILATDNRAGIRDTVVRHVVANELLVAREDESIVGFVMFTVESGQYAQATLRGLVRNVYVVPEYQNRGIGSALLEAAEGALIDRDVDAISLEVMARNEDARRFYRRHGYEPHRVELEKPTESDTL